MVSSSTVGAVGGQHDQYDRQDQPGRVDPSTVPVYPVVRLLAREGVAGMEAWGSGSLLGVCTSKAEASELLVQHAATLADHRPQRAIRVLFEGVPDHPATAVVTAAGQVVGSDPADRGGPSSRGRRRPRAGSRGLVIAAATVLVVALASAGVLVGHRWSHPAQTADGATPTSTAPAPVQLPVVPPTGWSSVATWSRRLPASGGTGSTQGVAVVGDTLVTVSDDGGSVVAVQVATGLERWSAEVGGGLKGGSVSGPVLVGADRVAAWTSRRLVTLSTTTGATAGSWDLESGAQVGAVGGGLVVAGLGQHAQILGTTGGLSDRVIPAASVPVGIVGDGLVVAGEGRAWLVRSPTVAGEGTVLTAPPGTFWAGPVAVVGDQLVAAFTPADSSSTVQLRSFSVGTWTVGWTTPAVPAAAAASLSSQSFQWGTGQAPAMQVSPSKTWGVYGSTVVDLRTGQVTALPTGWVTSTVGSQLGFGTVNGQVLSCTSTGAVATPPSSTGAPSLGTGAVLTTSTTTATPPVAVTDSGDAVIVAADGASRRVYLSPPLDRSSTSSSASTPKASADSQ